MSRHAHACYDTPAAEHVSIPVPPLVSGELFAATQQQLVANRQTHRERSSGAKYLLQGLVECGGCGYAYCGRQVSLAAAQGKTVYAYYRCIGTDGHRFGGQPVCDHGPIRTDMLDEAVWRDVQELLRDPQLVRREYERRLQTPSAESSRRRVLEQQQQSAQRAVGRLIDAYSDGVLEKSEFEPRLVKARARIARLHDELTQLDQQDVEQAQLRQALARLDEFSARIREGLDRADATTRREIVRTLIERIRVERDQVRLIYRINFPLFTRTASNERILHFCSRSHPPGGWSKLTGQN